MILLVIHLFKFHYDSINSVQMLIILPKIIDLNSIMILLIPEKAKTTATAKPDLNSIMILLIQVCFF